MFKDMEKWVSELILRIGTLVSFVRLLLGVQVAMTKGTGVLNRKEADVWLAFENLASHLWSSW